MTREKVALNFGYDPSYYDLGEDFEILEIAVTPKSYLKWENLDFSDTTARVKIKLVRMNGNVYELKVFHSGDEKFALITETSGQLCGTFREYNSKFFNDLHLEVIEDE